MFNSWLSRQEVEETEVVLPHENAKRPTADQINPVDTLKDTWGHFQTFFCGVKIVFGMFLWRLFVRSSPSATGAGISKPHLDVSLTRWCLCLNLTRADAQRCDERSLEDSTCYYFLQEMFWVDIHSCGCVEQQEAHLGTESKQTWWNNM